MKKAKLSNHLNIYKKNSPNKITMGQTSNSYGMVVHGSHYFMMQENPMAYKIPSTNVNTGI
jgi:hypothetical protein